MSIFSFSDYAQFLSVALNRRVSLAQWSRRLGYRSPRMVAMVLKKDRLPTQEMIGRFSQVLALSDSEHRYLELLVQLERQRKRGRETGPVLKSLEQLNLGVNRKPVLREEQFAVIADWYHVVIKQMIASPGFQESADWVCGQLRHKVTKAQFFCALQRMLQLGILKRHPRTRKLLVTSDSLRTLEDTPSECIRKHHREMLARAAEALDEQPVDKREITSKTLRIREQDIPAAKNELRRFKRLFEKKFENRNASSVYQLNLQLFSHTKEGVEL